MVCQNSGSGWGSLEESVFFLQAHFQPGNHHPVSGGISYRSYRDHSNVSLTTWFGHCEFLAGPPARNPFLWEIPQLNGGCFDPKYQL